MRPVTRYQFDRAVARFTAFQAGVRRLTLEQQIAAFLATLTANMAHTARLALVHQYGPQVDWGRIPKARRPRRDEAALQRTLFSDDAREHIRDAVETAREWAVVELLYVLRRAEAARARWGDIDWRRRIIYLVGKGGRRGWRLLPEMAALALEEWFKVSLAPPDEAPIFPSPHHAARTVTPETINVWVRAILKRAGLHRRGRNAHAFRRTFATEWQRANPRDLLGLKAAMGHERLSTTEQYVFLGPDDIRGALDRMQL